MKSLSRALVIFAGVSMMCLGCSDLVEKDISGNVVNVLSPADNFVSTDFDVVFWWDKVSNAQKYHLQIVQPSFDDIQTVIYDTLVSETKITLLLAPGSYAWRLRAENSNSSTGYVLRTLKVDSNSNLNGQAFYPGTPPDDYYTNSSFVQYSWTSYPYADMYEYSLTDANNVSVKVRTTSTTTLSDTLPEGSYFWKMRALNTVNNTATPYSAARSLFVDLTAPSPSTIVSPPNNSLDTNSVILSWTRDNDVVADSVLVASDSLFQNVLFRVLADNLPTYTLPPLILNDSYYWHLRSKDRAGNWSPYGPFFKFTITF
jgi:hypothetical protein